MKALSLWQPWANLVAVGAKRIETRSWATDHRGPLAIHATSKFPQEARDAARNPIFAQALGEGLLPRSAIVAVATLVGCYQFGYGSTNQTIGGEPVGALEETFGDFTPGRYGWLLKDVQRLAVPVPCPGARMLWDVPPEVESDIQRLLGGALSIGRHDAADYGPQKRLPLL